MNKSEMTAREKLYAELEKSISKMKENPEILICYEELKKRYKNAKTLPEKLSDLNSQNRDLPTQKLTKFIREVLGIAKAEKFYIKSGILQGKPNDLKEFIYCQVLPEFLDDLYWYTSPFDVHVGDMVKIKIGCYDDVNAEIKSICHCYGMEAPYPVHMTDSIIGKAQNDLPRIKERSYYETQESSFDSKKPDEIFTQRNDNVYFDYGKIRARGLGHQIMELLEYVKRNWGKRDWFELKKTITSTNIEDVYEIDLHSINHIHCYSGECAIDKVIREFPELKIVAFVELERRYRYIAAVCYSEPGYGFITYHKYVGEVDLNSEVGRYAFEKDPTSDFIAIIEDFDDYTKKAVSYIFPYKEEWDVYNYVIKENGICKLIINEPILNSEQISLENIDNSQVDGEYVNLNRAQAYIDSQDDFKWFNCKYSNPILESILAKYNYSSGKLDDPSDIQGLEDRIPNYKGVRTIEELSSTLISVLVSFGTADNGFEEELNIRKAEIQNAFLYIVGTSQETMDSENGELFLVDGFDFIMENGKYTSSYRQCDGGWSEMDTICTDNAFNNEV